MTLSPLDAISLSAAVLQFVEFGCQLFSKTNELYGGVDGVLLEHHHLNLVAQNTVQLNNAIELLIPSQNSSQRPSPEEEALLSIAQLCSKQAVEIGQLLNKLKVEGTNRRWKSFQQAFKSIWEESKIENMRRRLQEYRTQLLINLSLICRHQSKSDLESIKMQLREIREDKSLETEILTAIAGSSKAIRADVNALSQEFTSSRKVTADTLTLLSKSQSTPVLQLTNTVSSIVQQNLREKAQQKIRDSLYFPLINERYSRIHEAHSKTFDWIFEQNHEDAEARSTFMDWLKGNEYQEECFWITGKPGSGKSTLMRFLTDHESTKRHLESWSGRQQLCIASCFFWNPGSKVQKSFYGLLRTLLHQLFSQCHQLIEFASPWRFSQLQFFPIQLDDWTDSEMMETLHRFIETSALRFRVCIFIDGLDEFDGSIDARDSMNTLFKALGRLHNTRICVSSRPWNIYEDAFGSCPKLALHELTQGDICLYVGENLNRNERFQCLRLQSKENCDELIHAIVNKAQGVFLWVYLAVRSLLQGLRNEDDLRDLFERLALIPQDLEQIFKQLLTTIDPFYRPRVGRIIQILLITSTPPSLLSVSFFDDQSPETSIERLRENPEEETGRRKKSTKRRINGLAQGLLEVHEANFLGKLQQNDLLYHFRSHEVDFFHRTVRDYLLQDQSRSMLEGFLGVHQAGEASTMCRALLAQLKIAAPSTTSSKRKYLVRYGRLFLELLDEYFRYHSMLESGDDVSVGIRVNLESLITAFHTEMLQRDLNLQKEALHSRAKSLLSSFSASFFTHRYPQATVFDAFLIQVGQSQALDVRAVTQKCASSDRPLLDCALRRSYEISLSSGRANSYSERFMAPNVGVVRDLLVSGRADPNQLWQEGTLWGQFLCALQKAVTHLSGAEAIWAEAAELMLQHGADIYVSAKYPFIPRTTAQEILNQLSTPHSDHFKRLLGQQYMGFHNYQSILANRDTIDHTLFDLESLNNEILETRDDPPNKGNNSPLQERDLATQHSQEVKQRFRSQLPLSIRQFVKNRLLR